MKFPLTQSVFIGSALILLIVAVLPLCYSWVGAETDAVADLKQRILGK